MNLSLIDPFVLAQEYPDTLTGELSVDDVNAITTVGCGHACCLKFNHRGDYFASGRADGTIVIFDVETFGPARKLRGHSKNVQSVSWSPDSRYLLSASQDCKCILWDLQDGSRVRTVRFGTPIWMAEMHPDNPWLFVASLWEDHPLLVDTSNEKPAKKILNSVVLQPEEGDETSSKRKAAPAKNSTCITIFSSSGRYVFAGTSRGYVNIIDTKSCKTIYSLSIYQNHLVSLLRLSSNGRDLIVNCADKIRTIRLPDSLMTPSDSDSTSDADSPDIHLAVEHEFQDHVNKPNWSHAAFSGTSEFIVGSSKAKPDLYIWERSHGSLVKILEGSERSAVVEWHPHRPMFIACGAEAGYIYVWSIVTPQKWSALAPDFAEVEENVDYLEREDEFDIHTAEEVHQRRLDLEDEIPDVLTVERVRGVGAEKEDGKEFRMPVLLDISDSESDDDIMTVGPGQLRRKSPRVETDREGTAQAAQGTAKRSRR
ncbi:chromatin binding protein [Ascosphaera aggregata]|nr:chromatin binding protein [Ascosphaera aggregata]